MIKYLFVLLIFTMAVDSNCQLYDSPKRIIAFHSVSLINQDNYIPIDTYIQFQYYVNKKMYVLCGNMLKMNLVRFVDTWEIGVNAGVGYDFFKKSNSYYDHIAFANVAIGYNFNNLMIDFAHNMENSIMAGYKFVFEPYRKTSIITGLKYNNVIFMNNKNIGSLHLVLGINMML